MQRRDFGQRRRYERLETSRFYRATITRRQAFRFSSPIPILSSVRLRASSTRGSACSTGAPVVEVVFAHDFAPLRASGRKKPFVRCVHVLSATPNDYAPGSALNVVYQPFECRRQLPTFVFAVERIWWSARRPRGTWRRTKPGPDATQLPAGLQPAPFQRSALAQPQAQRRFLRTSGVRRPRRFARLRFSGNNTGEAQ